MTSASLWVKMGKVNQYYRPVGADILRGGRATKFVVQECHPVQNGGWYKDGYVGIIVKGEYHWELGDLIRVTKVNGWKLFRTFTGRYTFDIIGEIEFVKKADIPSLGSKASKYIKDLPED